MAADRNAILNTVRTHLAEILEMEITNIAEDSSFAYNLVAVSKTIPDFAFDDDDLVELRTVADAIDYIVRAHG